MPSFHGYLDTLGADPNAVFDWVSVPTARAAALLEGIGVKPHGYSVHSGGQELPYPEGLSGAELENGQFVLLTTHASFFRPRSRPPFGKLSRPAPLVVGRRWHHDVGCELWERGRQRWRVTTLSGTTVVEGPVPEALGADARTVGFAAGGFDPMALPLPGGARFIRYLRP